MNSSYPDNMRAQHALAGARNQSSNLTPAVSRRASSIALLTGGTDRPYVFGLTMALVTAGTTVDVVASDELEFPQFHDRPGVRFLKLRGDQRHDAGFLEKARRISSYYAKLIAYATVARPRLFHILWNNRFEVFDRTILMLYYKLLGKRVVLTAHNVNADKRDGRDSLINRLTLRAQYRLSDHVFVHTEKMKDELVEEFDVASSRVTVIPFGINNSVPCTALTSKEAKERLGVSEQDKTILFFGRITPYKGMEFLVAAFRQVSAILEHCRLVIAGRVDRCDRYWERIYQNMRPEMETGQIVVRDQFVPDDETEAYFKAADVLVLPYRSIYQSGVLFLAQSFGLPVLAADVGSLTDDIVEGHTGFVFKSEDSADLGRAIRQYFASDLYQSLDSRRKDIRDYAMKRHSWDLVAEKTIGAYAALLQTDFNQRNFKVASAAPPKTKKLIMKSPE
jgi:D-inositol-3-phosphate glycosyltransferase